MSTADSSRAPISGGFSGTLQVLPWFGRKTKSARQRRCNVDKTRIFCCTTRTHSRPRTKASLSAYIVTYGGTRRPVLPCYIVGIGVLCAIRVLYGPRDLPRRIHNENAIVSDDRRRPHAQSIFSGRIVRRPSIHWDRPINQNGREPTPQVAAAGGTRRPRLLDFFGRKTRIDRRPAKTVRPKIRQTHRRFPDTFP